MTHKLHISILLAFCLADIHSITATLEVIALAAGRSARFEGEISKLLTTINGKELVLYPVSAAIALHLPLTVVVGHQKEDVMNVILQAFPQEHINFAVQEKQLGTGHALQCTQDFWQADDILIMNGDHPLTTSTLLQTFIEHHYASDASMSILTAYADASCNYGRIIQENGITRIVEAVDFQNNPHDYPLVNAGFYLIKRSFLEKYIDKLWLHTNKNEYYITDLIEIAAREGFKVNLVPVAFNEVYGVNTMAEFQHAQKLLEQQQH
jgi:bifunctional UDP-N-acetylglucosamine pyrophosphorylase/glucosamine-1-phosphate N-acetyltransferase